MAFDHGASSIFFHKDDAEIVESTCVETAAKEDL